MALGLWISGCEDGVRIGKMISISLFGREFLLLSFIFWTLHKLEGVNWRLA